MHVSDLNKLEPCRLCGQTHWSTEIHNEIPPLLKEQINFENLLSFLEKSLLSTKERKIILTLVDELQKELGIPEEKIYLPRNPRYNFNLSEEQLLHELKKHAEEMQKKIRKTEARKVLVIKIIEILENIPVTNAGQEYIRHYSQWLIAL